MQGWKCYIYRAFDIKGNHGECPTKRMSNPRVGVSIPSIGTKEINGLLV